MLKVGGFYITNKGRLVKLFNQFNFGDGYTLSAAIYNPVAGWIPARYKSDGTCNLEPAYNSIGSIDTFASYHRYLQFHVWYDRTINLWRGKAMDLHGNLIVDLSNIEHQERAMNLLQIGAEQKILIWMREAGYEDEIKTEAVANAI